MKKTITFITCLVFPKLVLAQGFSSIGEVIARVIRLLLEFGGIIALIGLIIGGYKYITSAGNPEAVGEAKQSITWSIVGLIVILIAIIFVRFLMTSLGVQNQNLPFFGL